MSDARERADAVRACKWVDGVIEDVPYEVTDAFTDELIEIWGGVPVAMSRFWRPHLDLATIRNASNERLSARRRWSLTDPY